MRIQTFLGFIIIGLILSFSAPADAQWRGRGGEWEGRGDRGRDGDRGGGGFRGGFNPEEFWKGKDTNKDGIIAPDELDERTRRFFPGDKPVKISELVSQFEQRSREGGRGGDRGRDGDRDRGRDGDRDRGRDRDRNDREQNIEKPLVPGFGVEADEGATVPGFGPPEKGEMSNAQSGTPSTTSPSSSGSVGITGNSYVNGVFDKFDVDKNGVLEGDEIREARMPPTADANSDGKLTRDELVKAFPAKSLSTSSGSSHTGRRSYRFASAHDRLSGSAKSWIVSRDKNGDGQVAMHEFSSTWSESKIREFQKYDLNGDGIITAAEYESR